MLILIFYGAIVANGLRLTGFGITLKTQHDFRCPVPPRCDILSHVSRIFFWVDRETSSQTKVADLELAVGID